MRPIGGACRILPEGALVTSSQPQPKHRLDSWKEIAAFFERDERTVRRWEAERGLPVHRLPGNARGIVFAFTEELEEWLRRGSSQKEIGRSDISPDLQSGSGLHLAIDSNHENTSSPSPGAFAPTSENPVAPPPSVGRFAPWLLAGAMVVAAVVTLFLYRHAPHFIARARNRTTTALPHVPDPEAQDLYLKGRYHWSKRTPADLNQAIDFFTQAIVKDPGYSQAFVGLADCYDLLREFSAMPSNEAFPRALAAAQKAVELDPMSPEAHNSLAFVTYYWNWDAVTAEREHKRALALNPHYVQGHHWYATFLLANNRLPEALDQIEQARKLDPSSTAILADKGKILLGAGQQEEAITLLKQLETADPSLASTHRYLAQAYFDRKDYAGYLAESKRAAELRNDSDSLAVTKAAEKGFAVAGLRGMYEAMVPMQEKLVAAGRGSAYQLAATLASLGRKQDAIRYLQIAYDRHETDVMFLNTDACFAPLHQDPAYGRIIARVDERLPNIH